MSDLAPTEREHRVSPVELFFDLVFVFAFTQVTTLWLHYTSWSGLGRGLLILALLWWVWASYAWLTNAADAEAGIVTAVLVLATGAVFVAALAVPGAFGDHRVLFAVALFAVVAGFVGIYALVSKGEPEQLAAVLRMAQIVLPGAALVVLAAFLPLELQPAFWLAALITGFVGPQLGGLGGWRVHAAHFAERHGLIVIIAVGESLAAIGFGAEGARLGVGVIVAALLGLVAAASFWLAYFDFASGGIERLLAQRRGEQRVALARDAYTYAHLPMVAGIILFAFAMRATLEHVHAELALIPAIALCWGPALYLLAFVAVRWRVARTIGRGRPTAALAFLLLLPIATAVPAIVAVALVSLIWLALHGYELIWWREERARRRRRLPGRPDPHAEPTTESLRGRVS